jgi:hypothetical protein
VAELVDALASGASGFTAVKVRVLSWAPLPLPKIDVWRAQAPNGCSIWLGFLSNRSAVVEEIEGRRCDTGHSQVCEDFSHLLIAPLLMPGNS